jgi:hypothetical protein
LTHRTVEPNSAREFRDDDTGYRAWLASHPDGYVLNIARSYNASDARLHRADCGTISGSNSHQVMLTGPYVKVCADLAELERWASVHVGVPIRPCARCRPDGTPIRLNSTEQPQRATTTPLPEGRFTIHGPTADRAVVEAWADDYIRFERLPDWQKVLRTKLKSSCRQLEPSASEVLHARYFGSKHPKADIENILLYCIDSFRIAGRNGIRFEHGSAVPPSPDGADYPFCYRYALAPRSGAFTDWQQGRALASFGWTDLGSFIGDKRAAQVWLALARGEVEVFEPTLASDTPFAVKLQIRPPHGRRRVWGGLVKGIFDGVICALQAHTDVAVLPEVTARLAKILPAHPTEIEELLLGPRRAVMGAVPRLVSPYRNGVKWDPADHLCVAGELLADDPVDDRWAIRGEIVELSR